MSRGAVECLADSGTTHTILRNRQLFTELVPYKSSMTTLIGTSPVVKGRGTAEFMLPNGTVINVIDALYAPRINRTLLSFKDIRANGYHLDTYEENSNEFLCITSQEHGRRRILEKMSCIEDNGLYLTTARVFESYAVTNEFCDTEIYRLWHIRLGHPGRDMMIRILKNSHGHPFFKSKKRLEEPLSTTQRRDVQRSQAPRKAVALKPHVPPHPSRGHEAVHPALEDEAEPTSEDEGEAMTPPSVPPSVVAPLVSSNATTAISNAHRLPCKACALVKLQAPSFAKASTENIPFLHRIQGDICGPIKPECGPFKYFMVLVDVSTRWSHVALLSTRNAAFAKLLAQIIKLRAHHPDHPIKSIRLDNAGEFTSKAFDDYCISVGIEVEHPVPHVHSQNGLAEAAIQRLQNVARALVMGPILHIAHINNDPPSHLLPTLYRILMCFSW